MGQQYLRYVQLDTTGCHVTDESIVSATRPLPSRQQKWVLRNFKFKGDFKRGECFLRGREGVFSMNFSITFFAKKT